MFRLLGFVVGTVTSILVILLVVGMPQFGPADDEVDQARYDAALEMLRARQSEVESVAERLTEDMARVEVAREAASGAPADEAAAIEPEAAPATADEGLQDPAGTALPGHPEQAHGRDRAAGWYSFWSPFRSEIAANGFVAQLERVTGLDYRIVKVKSGVYEVAFAYADAVERDRKLAQIALATGLDLPDS